MYQYFQKHPVYLYGTVALVLTGICVTVALVLAGIYGSVALVLAGI